MTRERTEGKRMSRHCLAADRRFALGVAPGFWRPYYGEVVTGGAVSERPLLERGAELEDIELVLNGAAAGHGAVLPIEGAGGVGRGGAPRAGPPSLGGRGGVGRGGAPPPPPRIGARGPPPPRPDGRPPC